CVYDMRELKPGQVGDDNFLQFLFGMKAVDAKSRYQLTYVVGSRAEDKHYHYLSILPKQAQDKADFDQAQLTLLADTFLPRRIWYHQPNGTEITWDFPQVHRNVHIKLDVFEPQQPKGWELRRMEARNVQPPPTVV